MFIALANVDFSVTLITLITLEKVSNKYDHFFC